MPRAISCQLVLLAAGTSQAGPAPALAGSKRPVSLRHRLGELSIGSSPGAIM